MEGPVAIVGITGNVGQRLGSKLASKGVEVRGIARDPAPVQGTRGIKAVQADLTRPQDAARALEGASQVYLTLPEEGDDPFQLERTVARNVLEAAAQAGVAHLVLHTALHADQGATGVRILDVKAPVERELAERGLPHTILRPGFFLQNLFQAKGGIEQGTLSMPLAPDRKVGAVSVEDIANAALGFLDKGPQDRGFDLHVDDGVEFRNIAQRAGELLGREVRYHPFEGPPRQFVERYPLSPAHKDAYAEFFAYLHRQDYLGRSRDITRALPGFRYTPPEEFLRNELLADRGM